MSLTKREKAALTKFMKAYAAELDKVLAANKKPVDLSIKPLSLSVPKSTTK